MVKRSFDFCPRYFSVSFQISKIIVHNFYKHHLLCCIIIYIVYNAMYIPIYFIGTMKISFSWLIICFLCFLRFLASENSVQIFQGFFRNSLLQDSSLKKVK